MTRLVRAELLKLRTTKVTLVLLAVGAVMAGLLAALVVVRSSTAAQQVGLPLVGSVAWRRLVLGLSGVTEYFALVAGILCVAGEYRHGTITSTFLVEPRRGRVIAAKLGASGLAGAVFAIAAMVLVISVAAGVSAAERAATGNVVPALPAVAPGLILATALYGVYGAGLGALLRNQVLAVVIALSFSLIGESIVTDLLPQVGKWLPDAAAASFSSSSQAEQIQGSAHMLVWWAGGLVLLAYGISAALVGVMIAVRSDVT
ncbi:MAG: ABC transporter permease [Acidimicrobiales bacterium]